MVAASGVAFVPGWISWVELQAVVDPVQQELAAASLELVMELEQVPVQEVELGRELVPLDWIWLAPEVEAAGQAWEQGQLVSVASVVVEACSGMPCVVLLEVAAAWVAA